jgi:hypothetical protein
LHNNPTVDISSFTYIKQQLEIHMSGSNGVGGRGAGVAAMSGVAVLPFTGGNVYVSYIVLTAIVCAVAVLAVKVLKRVMVRG